MSDWGAAHYNKKRYRIVKVERYDIKGNPIEYYIVQFRRLRFFWVTASEWVEKPNQDKAVEYRFGSEEEARNAIKSWRDERYNQKKTVVSHIDENDRNLS